MRSAEEWFNEFVDLDLFWSGSNEKIRNFIKRIQQDAIASQQPAPSGDAMELAHFIISRTCDECDDNGGWAALEQAVAEKIQSFATATREKALEEAAQLCDDHKLREEEQDFWVKNMPQMLASEIRALAKRGG